MVALFTFILVPVILAASFLIDGFVLSILWNWFIPRIFIGAPTLSILNAIGLAIVIGFLTRKYQKPDSYNGKNLWPFLYLFVGPFIALFFGWIVHLFM